MNWYRAIRLATAVLLLFPAVVRAEDENRLVAGDGVVLVHPPINDSVFNPVHCLNFLNDATLVTGATSGALIWDTSSGELRQTLEVDERAVDSLALGPRGKLLVAGGATGVIVVFDAQSLAPVRTIGPVSGAVGALAISPDGKLLASASPNGRLDQDDRPFGVQLWDLATGEPSGEIPHPPPAFGATALAFRPDGKQLITAQDRAFRVFDVESRQVVEAVELPDLPRSLSSFALRRDGQLLLTGAFESRLRLWDPRTWKQTLVWDAHAEQPPPEHGVSSVAFSPDGRYALSGGMDGTVCVWNASSGRLLLELDGRVDAPRRQWITGVAMSPDSRLLAATHFGSTATLWRISDE